MKALSIRNPWAWLITQGIKDIENRDWATSYRGPLLIHASKKWDLETWEVDGFQRTMKRRGIVLPETYPSGGIVGIATLVDCVTASDSVWFSGAFGLVLANARPLPLIPYPGKLGLFDVPDKIVKVHL